MRGQGFVNRGRPIRHVNTWADLKNFFPRVDGEVVHLLGYNTIGDGGGGDFRYDASAADADNGGTVAAPNTGGGRYFRQASGPNNVKWFGAVGNGITNDQPAIQAAANVGDISFPDKATYLISSRITLTNSNVHIFGHGSTVTCNTSTNAFYATGLTEIILEDLEVIGSDPTDTAVDRGLLHFVNSTNVTVKSCKLSQFSDLVWAHSNENVWVKDSVLSSFNLNGVVASRTVSSYISNNTITDSTQLGAGNAYGIQATGDNAGGNVQSSVHITDNYIQDIPAWDGIMTHDTDHITITGNVIKNVRIGIDIGQLIDANVVQHIFVANNYIVCTDTNTWDPASASNSGIKLTGRSPTVLVSDATIIGNSVEGGADFASPSSGGGILLTHVERVRVHDNYIKESGTAFSSAAGLVLNGVVNEVTVSGNIFTDTSTTGIQFFSATVNNGNFIGNEFLNTAGGSMTSCIKMANSSTLSNVHFLQNFSGLPVFSIGGSTTLTAVTAALSGSGTPEGNVSAPPGSTWHRSDDVNSFSFKQSGTGTTGWTNSIGKDDNNVISLPSGTTPGAADADNALLWVEDRGGTAGEASLHGKNESGTVFVLGDIFGFGTVTPDTGIAEFRSRDPYLIISDDNASAVGTSDARIEFNDFNGDRIGWIGYSAGTDDISVKPLTSGSTLRLGAANVIHWVLKAGGELEAQTAQTIQTLTGDLTLATGAANGDVIVSPNGTGILDVNADMIRIRDTKTPASAADTGTTGQIAWDSNFIYVCVATDTWKRVGIATW